MAVALPVFYHGGPPWQQHVYRDNNVLYYIPPLGKEAGAYPRSFKVYCCEYVPNALDNPYN